MNETHLTTSTFPLKQKRAWSSPVLVNLTLVDTAAGKSTTVQEGCKTTGGGTTSCKPQWQNSFGLS